MAGKRYSAGAIFLQVVPVFANVQRAIEDEAKNIDRALGDQMERSGEKAGDRAGEAASKAMKDKIAKGGIDKELERQIQSGVADIDKALAGINTKNLGKKLRSEVASMRSELDSLKGVDLTVDDNLDKVRARVAATQAQIEEMRKRSKVFFDIKGLPQVYRSIAGIQTAIDKIDADIKVDVDTKDADRKMGAFEKRFKKTAKSAAEALSGAASKELRTLGKELAHYDNLRIGVEISANQARSELNEIRADLERLQADSTDIDVRIDSGVAIAELAALEAYLEKIEADDVDIDVDTHGIARAGAAAKAAGRDGETAANSFRSFNIVLLAAVSAGPALVPILAAIAGGLLALGPAAAVGAFGLGSVLVGFSGLGDALTALQNQQDQAATNAQSAAKRQSGAADQIRNAQQSLADAVRNAARAEEDAAERVSDARRSAARAAEDAAERVKDAREAAAEAIEDSLERQKDAQEDYRDAVQDVADAEQALRDARADAQKDAETLAKRQRQNAVDEREAVMDLFDAQVEYNAVMADGSSTATDKERASINLEQAQIALNDTRDEQVALAEEAADYAANGVDGSKKVKTAQEQLTEAIEAQKEALEATKDAAREVDEVREEGAERVSRALEDQNEILSDNARAIRQALEDQAESHDDNARAISRAREALSQARKQATEDLSAIDSQAQAVEAAFDKLGPAGKEFALFLFSLKSGFYEFRDAVQQAMLPAVQQAIEGFIGSNNASKAKNAIVELARGFGEFTKALSASFQGPAWAAFFEMLASTGVKIQKAYGDAFISLMEAFASILTTTAPFALRFAEGLAALSDAFADWAASKSGKKDLLEFIEYVESVGPAVLDFFAALASATVAVMKALAPYAEMVLGALTATLEFIAQMDQGILGALLTGVTVVLLASQVAYGVMNLMMAGAALFATSVGPWIFLIVGVGIALGVLYKTNEKFRDFINEAWTEISAVLKDSWENTLKPALTEFWEVLQQLWDEVLAPFFAWLGPIIVWAVKKVIPLLAWVFSEIIKEITWGIKNVLIPWLKGMGKTWGEIVDAMVWVWDHVLKPAWDYITDTALPALQKAFEATVSGIELAWNTLRDILTAPIRMVIEDVINGGIIAAYNKIAKWVGADEIDPLPVPGFAQKTSQREERRATGGILPGYTPGRDVHTFVSPTAGRLHLSGGEAVMRPEWTAAMGPAYVDQMNALARRGGARAVQRAMGMVGGFWNGGVLPLLGGSVSSHGSAYGHPAFDMNYPGYADYGKPVRAWRDGILAQKNYIGDASYGRWAVVNHADGLSSLYAHLSSFADVAIGKAIKAGQTLGYVGDLGNTGNPPTSHLHFEVMGGNVGISEMGAGGGGEKKRAIPSWLMDVVKDPLGAFKGWITDPIKSATGAFVGSPLFDMVTKVPAMLGEKVVDKVWDVVPGWVKTAAGWAGDAAEWAVGGVKSAYNTLDNIGDSINSGIRGGAEAVGNFLGLADGGILPYNGTMMYDSGGYLPPGMTTVMNLTGKPEPVFTADQFDGLSLGGEGLTYAPTFQGSNLTAADVVDDLDFTLRKIQRDVRYGRNR